MSSVPERLAEVLPVVRDHADRCDAEARFPSESVDALRAAGLMGLLVPKEHGGLGADLRTFAETAQTLAGACLSTAMIWAMHGQQVDAVVRHAGPRLAGELLPRIARGEVYLASVTTEPGKGGHLLSADAALTAERQLLHFDRTGPVVTGAEHADGFLITLRAAPDAPSNQVSLVYAEREQTVVELVGDWNPLGMRATQSTGIRLKGTVPADRLVGGAGEFRTVAIDSMVPVGHIAWASCWLGAARSGYQRLVRLLTSRERPRGIDLTSPLTTERLARIRTDLELVSGYLHGVIAEIDQTRATGADAADPAVQIHLNTLKIAASELAFGATDRMVQLAGLTLGYQRDSPLRLERLFRDLRSAALNYANDRLLTSNGSLCLLDRGVRLLSAPLGGLTSEQMSP
ncbi:acyl-CoA dehydrogenase family protein [Streptomyces adelaidensis]|uniref:acyl-CoA dehydrogenase family protein n=1 Tax=Streptomyces adelaidensis TaxID=2796465 RepID=UPI001908DF8F|nr:acyl-CoA dehydrogenase family protein [Streptomyces adelaidensis]